MRAIRRFLSDLFGAYGDGFRVLRGLPLVFGAIVAWELCQHVVEYQVGFFDSRATAKAVSHDPSRMALGWVKMILVYVGGFVAIRHLVLNGRGRVLRPSLRAVLAYLPYLAYSLLVFALIFYADALVPAARVGALRATVGLAQLAIEPLLMPWIVSAATDGPIRDPLRSARRVGRFYFRTLALFFLGRTAIGAAHQFLGTYPIGKSAALMWPMLIADAAVVGLLIAIVPALYVRATAWIDERRRLDRISMREDTITAKAADRDGHPRFPG